MRKGSNTTKLAITTSHTFVPRKTLAAEKLKISGRSTLVGGSSLALIVIDCMFFW